MNKKDIKYYSAIVVILLLTILFEIFKPKPIDWRFTLESKSKEPYGTFVLFNTIQELFPNNKITTNKRTSYEFSKHKRNTQKNYIYITNQFNVDKLDTEAILSFLESGNNVLISAHSISKTLSDTLKISINNTIFFDTTSSLNFYNKNLKKEKPYFFGKTASNFFFDSFNTDETEVLAYSANDKPVFIKQEKGQGTLYLNTFPEVYTNYAMVTEKNYQFAYSSLSYLPLKEIIWDEYYKPFRKQNKNELSFIFENSSYKTAYIVLIITTFIFIFFTIKRRQRIIPIIKPVSNKTLEFVETIGRVYFHSKNHKDIALKKFLFFKNFVRKKYNINFPENEKFDYEKFSEKTGVEISIIKKVLLTFAKINKLEKVSEEQLNNFNNYIEDFYDNCK